LYFELMFVSLGMAKKQELIMRQYKNDDGTVDRFYYSIERPEGPVKAEYNVKATDEILSDDPSKALAQQVAKANKGLPRTKQRFINPATGTDVSYIRAKQLGII
jgi:hypothetical protein